MRNAERERLWRRHNRWVNNAQELEHDLDKMLDRVFELIREEQEDWECHEWHDGCPPKEIQHPLFEVALKLEEANFIAFERVRELQGDET